MNQKIIPELLTRVFTTKCPICDYELGEFPWGENGDLSSFLICPSCGVEFGYTDMCGGSEESRKKLYQLWRKAWEENGKKALKEGQYKPLIKEACSSDSKKG